MGDYCEEICSNKFGIFHTVCYKICKENLGLGIIEPSPIVEMKVSEGIKARQLRKTVGLDDVAKDLKGKVQYILHQNSKSISRAETMRRCGTPELKSTQDVKATLKKGGGDCDDLALLYAYKLQLECNNPNYEFGVMYGYVKVRANRYEGHALLTIRDRRYPNRYESYDVSNVRRGPEYAGPFNRYGPNNKFPTPRGNDKFILNVYVPVKSDGTLDLSSRKYFVPKSK